jgi:hypothetical protein
MGRETSNVARSVVRTDVVPFLLIFGGLVLSALVLDLILHFLDLVWVGRYLGIAGTIFILVSFGYSLRKRKVITGGTLKGMLRWHTILAWTGSLLVLVHAGVHFAAFLPWLATVAMLINVLSGLTGRLLLDRARHHFSERKEQLLSAGLSDAAAEEQLHWDSVALNVMNKWREIHLPITIAFATLALGHIISIFLFWGWS